MLRRALLQLRVVIYHLPRTYPRLDDRRVRGDDDRLVAFRRVEHLPVALEPERVCAFLAAVPFVEVDDEADYPCHADARPGYCACDDGCLGFMAIMGGFFVN